LDQPFDRLRIIPEVRDNLGLTTIIKDPGDFDRALKAKALRTMAGIGF
jgi:hypothetical protein